MSHFEILLPFGLPDPQMSHDLLRQLRAPALEMLLARSKPPVYREFDPFSRMLPHEAWLYGGSDDAPTSPPLASSLMQKLGLAPEPGTWFVVQPVHIHIARDHLVLVDMRRCPLSDTESRALFDAAYPHFEQAGKALRYGDAKTWFMRADDWNKLQTATPDAAGGHNIDIWMPKGDGERAWRKLQNEVQMEWHEHAVNEARSGMRLQPINSLWIWGASDSAQAATQTTRATHAIADANATAAAWLSSGTESRLMVLDDLSEAALAEDWGSWLDKLQALDANWFAPLLDALRTGKARQLKLIVTSTTQLRAFEIGKMALRKFWAKPSLARLATQSSPPSP
jgi:hypothetical protein